jgi:hypothetical protein
MHPQVGIGFLLCCRCLIGGQQEQLQLTAAAAAAAAPAAPAEGLSHADHASEPSAQAEVPDASQQEVPSDDGSMQDELLTHGEDAEEWELAAGMDAEDQRQDLAAATAAAVADVDAALAAAEQRQQQQQRAAAAARRSERLRWQLLSW